MIAAIIVAVVLVGGIIAYKKLFVSKAPSVTPPPTPTPSSNTANH